MVWKVYGIMYIIVYTKTGFYLHVCMHIIKVQNWLYSSATCMKSALLHWTNGLCLWETDIAVNCLGVAPQRHLQQSKAAYTCLTLHVENASLPPLPSTAEALYAV